MPLYLVGPKYYYFFLFFTFSFAQPLWATLITSKFSKSCFEKGSMGVGSNRFLATRKNILVSYSLHNVYTKPLYLTAQIFHNNFIGKWCFYHNFLLNHESCYIHGSLTSAYLNTTQITSVSLYMPLVRHLPPPPPFLRQPWGHFG